MPILKKKTTTDMNTLACYMKEIGKNVKVENLPAAELDHLLCKFFMNVHKKNGQEYEPDSISRFQRSIQRYLSEKGSSVNLLKDEDKVEKKKSRERFSLQNASRLFMITAKVTGEFGDSNPTSLKRAVWQNRSSQDQVWYMRYPLGKNEIGKFLSTAAQKAGIHREGKRVTNNLVRKTCISRLLDADIPENSVAQLSGH